MKIKEKFDRHIEQVGELFKQFPFEEKEAYFAWMNQHYYLVQHSTRYICLAASLADVSDDKTFKHWTHHLDEEIDHDKVLLKDMQNLMIQDLAPPTPETRALIATQYYDLNRHGSDAILGYALLLEGLSCSIADSVAQRIEKAHGKKSGFLKLHGSVDLEHYPNGIKHVESLSHQKQSVVISNLEVSACLYSYFLKSLALRK